MKKSTVWYTVVLLLCGFCYVVLGGQSTCTPETLDFNGTYLFTLSYEDGFASGGSLTIVQEGQLVDVDMNLTHIADQPLSGTGTVSGDQISFEVVDESWTPDRTPEPTSLTFNGRGIDLNEDGMVDTLNGVFGGTECTDTCEEVVGDFDASYSVDGVVIPEGSFMMGCNEAVDDDCLSDEYPYHEVFLDGYYIDRTEVTQEAFKDCVDTGVCNMPDCNWDPSGTPDHPVVCIDWYDAKTYCEWAGKRLPTEAEWEKAARGTDGRKYPWGNESPTCDLVVGDNCTEDVQSVCSRSPVGDSPYGLCDMTGNVWEWVADWYDSDYYETSPTDNPQGPISGYSWVERGGSFDASGGVGMLRTSGRGYGTYAALGVGFRCVRYTSY